MFDVTFIQGFEWDAGNSRKNADKHGVTQGEAEQVFFNEPLIVATDRAHSIVEPRYHALGRTENDRLLHITFTVRGDGTLIRVISARAMSRKERQIYGQEA
jgi:uncharacterized DUF497 family protein